MNILEIIPVLIGIISVYFSIKQNLLTWVFGIISSTLLLFYFININFYGQVALQFVSIIQCAVGIVRWNKIDNKEVRNFGFNKTILFILIATILGFIFTKTTNETSDNWLYIDGISGIVALVATYLLIMKKIEAWWVFMISNLLVSILCIHQGSYYIAVYNLLLFSMSIKGYKEWKKELV